jgi:3-(3-hydroxy-phenyl)propionate hydroxylase
VGRNIAVVDDGGEAYLQRLGAKAVMLRPDRYILGTAETVADLETLLAHVPSPSTAEKAA